MKTLTALLAIVLTTTFTLTTAAQEVEGTWQVQTVSGVEPPEGASLSLNLRDGNEATLTYTLAGETQSWKYAYAVAEGQLTLEPAKAFGEPETVTYDIRFDEDGKLELLTPKPEPVEEETDEAEEGDAAEGEGEEAAADTAEEEAEEEDTRVAVWVLVKA